MTTEKLQQLEAEEQQLLKRLKEIRKEIKKLITQEKPVTSNQTSTINSNYQRDALNEMTKGEIVTIANKLNIPLSKNDTKLKVIDHILRNQRARARGNAFNEMMRG